MPNVIYVKLLILRRKRLSYASLRVIDFSCQLCGIICEIHEHCDGSKVRVDVLVVGLSELLNASKNSHEVFLPETVDVVTDYKFQAFKPVLKDLLLLFILIMGLSLLLFRAGKTAFRQISLSFTGHPHIHDDDTPSIISNILATQLDNPFN